MRHGTTGAYKSCRCAECADAWRRYRKRWELDRRRGVARLVDAAEVSAHIDMLRVWGMSLGQIAGASGTNKTTVGGLEQRRSKRVRASTAERILAVRPDEIVVTDPADETFVPIHGSVRRIQALQAIGWTHAAMRAECGVETHLVLSCANGNGGGAGRWITARNHLRIAKMFDRLHMAPGPSSHTRARARLKGWAPPLAWDEGDIDDPNAQPQGITRADCATCDDTEHLLDTGADARDIAERLGWSANGLAKHLRRCGRRDLAAPFDRADQRARRAGAC